MSNHLQNIRPHISIVAVSRGVLLDFRAATARREEGRQVGVVPETFSVRLVVVRHASLEHNSAGLVGLAPPHEVDDCGRKRNGR